jgi:cytochrome b561
MTATTYDRATIAFHWTTAALVVVLWLLGQTADWFPKGAPREVAWSTHFTLGFLLALAWIGRLVWRLSGGRRLPGVGPAYMVKLSAAVHGLLYLIIAFVIVVGVGNLYAHGQNIWGLVSFPKLSDAALRRTISETHEWAANILLALAAGHAAVALVHQYALRDGVLARMWPSLARR